MTRRRKICIQQTFDTETEERAICEIGVTVEILAF